MFMPKEMRACASTGKAEFVGDQEVKLDAGSRRPTVIAPRGFSSSVETTGYAQ
jgi:hypothetical protein